MKRLMFNLFEATVYAMGCAYHALLFVAIACYLAVTAVWIAGNAAWLWEVTR